jgi:hypothetical protein
MKSFLLLEGQCAHLLKPFDRNLATSGLFISIDTASLNAKIHERLEEIMVAD